MLWWQSKAYTSWKIKDDTSTLCNSELQRIDVSPLIFQLMYHNNYILFFLYFLGSLIQQTECNTFNKQRVSYFEYCQENHAGVK